MQLFAEIVKEDPGTADVHVATALGNATASRRRRRRLRRGDPAMSVIKDDAAWSLSVPILKTDDELRTVYGWASVITEKGAVVTDHQDDQIEEAELVKAAHAFMADHRTGGLLHAQRSDGTAHSGGDVVESLVLTPDVQKAIGVDLGKTGWFIGYRVTDPDAWSLVKSGTLKAFSIGGQARRVPMGT